MDYYKSTYFMVDFPTAVITLCTDFVVLVCAWKDLKLRTNLAKKLLFLIAIVDVLSLLAVIVKLLLRITTNSFLGCTFSLCAQVFLILMHCGVTNLLALERAVALGAPFWYHRNCHRRILYLGVVFLIVIYMPIAVLIPTLGLNDIRENSNGTTECIVMLLIPSPSMKKVTLTIAIIGLFSHFLNLIWNCVVLRIVSKMNRAVRPNVNGRNNQKKFFPVEFQMTKLCVVLCLSYCICWVPIALVLGLSLFGIPITTTVLVSKYMFKLGFIVDPIIYLAFMKKYRQWIREACCKVKDGILCHREEPPSTVTEQY